MTKEKELAILLETAHQLGCDSYCGKWLSDMIAPLHDCMKSDSLPEVYFSEDRFLQRALDKQSALMQAAHDKAEKIVQAAEKDAAMIVQAAEKATQSQREWIARTQAEMLAQARAMVRNLENI